MKKIVIVIIALLCGGFGWFYYQKSSAASSSVASNNNLYKRALASNNPRKISSHQRALVKKYLNDYLINDPQHTDSAYISSSANKSTAISEAQGYGMMIAVLAQRNGLNTKNDFQKLDNYYQAHLDGNTQLMSWKQTFSNGVATKEPNSATDGDLWVAESLIIAANVYHNPIYAKQAKTIINAITKYDYNPKLNTLTFGNWVTNDSKDASYVRTSDCLPEFFQDFYNFTKDKRWLKIKKSMSRVLVLSSNLSSTGLIPDFVSFNGNRVKPANNNYQSDPMAGNFGYSALRIPLNLAFSKNNKMLQPVLSKMSKFFISQSTLKAGYKLNGTVISNWSTEALNGPVLALMSTQNSRHASSLANSMNNYVLAQGITRQHYYEETLGILGILVGNLEK